MHSFCCGEGRLLVWLARLKAPVELGFRVDFRTLQRDGHKMDSAELIVLMRPELLILAQIVALECAAVRVMGRPEGRVMIPVKSRPSHVNTSL